MNYHEDSLVDRRRRPLRQLADKAAGVLIFGRVTKAGAGVAGEYGEGVLRLKGDTADYYQVAGDLSFEGSKISKIKD